jgi:aryl-alcohol dehydrogenase-like predicted oxidoreductase
MEFRPLGQSGIEVSALCLGSWLTFEYMDRADARAVLQRAVDAGVRFFDDARYDDRTGTAPIPSGYSEVVFGEVFRAGGFARDDFVIANKLWFEFHPEESIEAELDGSLGRLGFDRIDLLYCAEPPGSLPLPDLIGALDALVAAGKIRAWGVLNWEPARLEEAHHLAVSDGLVPPAAAQLPHNLLDRGFVEGPSARKALEATGTSVVASHCLAGGLLTGKYSRAGSSGDTPGPPGTSGDTPGPPGTSGRLGADRIDRLREEGVLDRIKVWEELATRHGATAAQLALAFSLSRPGVASACFGAKSVAQLEEDVCAIDVLPLLREAIAELERSTGEPADPV